MEKVTTISNRYGSEDGFNNTYTFNYRIHGGVENFFSDKNGQLYIFSFHPSKEFDRASELVVKSYPSVWVLCVEWTTSPPLETDENWRRSFPDIISDWIFLSFTLGYETTNVKWNGFTTYPLYKEKVSLSLQNYISTWETFMLKVLKDMKVVKVDEISFDVSLRVKGAAQYFGTPTDLHDDPILVPIPIEKLPPTKQKDEWKDIFAFISSLCVFSKSREEVRAKPVVHNVLVRIVNGEPVIYSVRKVVDRRKVSTPS